MFVGGLANISSQGVFEDSKLFCHTVWRHCAETDDPECVPQKNEGKQRTDPSVSLGLSFHGYQSQQQNRPLLIIIPA